MELENGTKRNRRFRLWKPSFLGSMLNLERIGDQHPTQKKVMTAGGFWKIFFTETWGFVGIYPET